MNVLVFLVIAGDFHFHMDDPSDADAKKLNDLLETFVLSQHVTFATHVSGHWLDLIITRASNDIIIIIIIINFIYRG